MRKGVPKPEFSDPLCRVIFSTTQRFVDGFMAKSTWNHHLRFVWNRIDALGIRSDVEVIIPSDSKMHRKPRRTLRRKEGRA